jgi:hypothetical protein
MPNNATPLAGIIEPTGLAQTIWRAAYARSSNINMDMLMVDSEAAAMKVLRVGYNLTAGILPRLIGGMWKEGSFTMEAQSAGEKKIVTDAEAIFRDSCNYLVRCVGAGGGAGFVQFLEEKQHQTRYALESLRYKAMECANVNREVMGELERCIDFSHRVKVVSEATMVVLGAFVPVSWVVQTGIAAAYTLTCEVAKSASQVQSADLLGFLVAGKDGLVGTVSEDNLKNNAAGAACNIAQDVTGAAATRTSYLLAKLQAENLRLNSMMDTRIRAYLAQRGPGANPANYHWLSGTQRQTVARGFQQMEQNSANIAAAQARNGLAQAAKWGARGVSIGIGLLFMKDEIAKAWYGATEYERMQREGSRN